MRGLTSSIFHSEEWAKRWQKAGFSAHGPDQQNRWGFDYARTIYPELCDYEKLSDPETTEKARQQGAHFFVHHKVLHPLSDQPWVFVPHPGTYVLDLKRNQFSKSLIDRVLVSERRFERRFGPLSISEMRLDQVKDWIPFWRSFLGDRFPDAPLLRPEYNEPVRTWLTCDSLPPWMKLFMLKAGHEVVAVCWAYSWNGVLSLYSPMINQEREIGRIGPGRILIHELCRWGLEEGIETVDFLHGDHHYKLEWGAEPQPLYSAYLPLTLTGELLVKTISWRTKRAAPLWGIPSDAVAAGSETTTDGPAKIQSPRSTASIQQRRA